MATSVQRKPNVEPLPAAPAFLPVESCIKQLLDLCTRHGALREFRSELTIEGKQHLEAFEKWRMWGFIAGRDSSIFVPMGFHRRLDALLQAPLGSPWIGDKVFAVLDRETGVQILTPQVMIDRVAHHQPVLCASSGEMRSPLLGRIGKVELRMIYAQRTGRHDCFYRFQPDPDCAIQFTTAMIERWIKEECAIQLKAWVTVLPDPGKLK